MVTSPSFYLYKWLHVPPRLHKSIDLGADDDAVVLLHGIGRTGSVWSHVVEGLQRLPVRIVAFDLLGFGGSPKPQWSDYSTKDHTASVIAAIEKLGSKKPVILVGHSMGCLIAVKVARERPDLVDHLVLYEMPLYDGLPDKRIYRLRLAIYAKLYKQVLAFEPAFIPSQMKRTEKIARKIVGFEVTPETWQPFIKSLRNTVLNQEAASDIKRLSMPVDVIYGTRDMLVIKGKPKQIYGEDLPHLTTLKVRARHSISAKASTLIVSRIQSALMKQSEESVN